MIHVIFTDDTQNDRSGKDCASIPSFSVDFRPKGFLMVETASELGKSGRGMDFV